MTTVTVGKDNLKLILTYDLENIENNRLVFTGSDLNSQDCEFIVTELNINLAPLNWLTQTTYRLLVKHTNRDADAHPEKFMLIVLKDATGTIVSATSSFDRIYETWGAAEPDRCCPRSTVVYEIE